MITEAFTNQAQTTVASGGTTAPSSGTTETWTVVSTVSFPAASTGASQFRVVDPATGKSGEIILVTNVSGTTWSVTRGAENSTPVAHSAGFTIQQVVTEGTLAGFAQATTAPGDASAVLDSTGNWTAPAGFYRPAPQLPRYPRTIITQFQSGHGFTAATSGTGTNVNDTTAANFIAGSQAATIVTKGDGSSFTNLTNTSLSFDATGRYMCLRYRIDEVLNAQALHLDVSSDTSFTNFWRWDFHDGVTTLGAGYSYDGEWEQLIFSFGDATVTGTPNRAACVAVRLRARDWAGSPPSPAPVQANAAMTIQWQEVSLIEDPQALFPSGLVTFCFDDIYATQYTNAKPVMDALGQRATLAVIGDAIGVGSSMTMAQLQTLQNVSGWEIGLHANTSAVHSATDPGVALGVVETDLRQEKIRFQQNGLNSSRTFAYPSGLWNPAILALLGQYVSAARLNFLNAGQETFPPANPMKLRACGAISSLALNQHTAAFVQTQIDAAKANRSWLILVFHKILSSGSPATSTECTLADFTTIANYVAASGMPVRTISEVMRLVEADSRTVVDAAGRLQPTAIKTAAYAAAARDLVPCDTTSAGFTVTLPFKPRDMTRIGAQIVKGSSTLTYATGSRTDAGCVTTNTSATVTDTSITSSDVGRLVTGAGIPANTTVLSVTAGTSFVLSSAATASATVSLTISDTLYDGLSVTGTLTAAGQLVVLQYAAATGRWLPTSSTAAPGGGASLDTTDLPLALGTAAHGSGPGASPSDHVHPPTGLAASSVNKQGSGALTPSATISTFGTTATMNPDSGFAGIFPTAVTYVASGVASETVTVQSVVTWSDSTTTTTTTTTTTNSTANLSASQMVALLAGGDAKHATSIAWSVKSSIANSTASVTVTLLGLNQY